MCLHIRFQFLVSMQPTGISVSYPKTVEQHFPVAPEESVSSVFGIRTDCWSGHSAE